MGHRRAPGSRISALGSEALPCDQFRTDCSTWIQSCPSRSWLHWPGLDWSIRCFWRQGSTASWSPSWSISLMRLPGLQTGPRSHWSCCPLRWAPRASENFYSTWPPRELCCQTYILWDSRIWDLWGTCSGPISRLVRHLWDKRQGQVFEATAVRPYSSFPSRSAYSGIF